MIKTLLILIVSLILLTSCGDSVSLGDTEIKENIDLISENSQNKTDEDPEKAVEEVKTYNEYFAETYKFEDTSLEYYPEDTIFYENRDIGSYLMKEKLSTNTHSVVLYENTRSHYLYKDRIFCIINDKQVVSINLDGTDMKYIYEDDEQISNLYANDELLFFTKNDSIYRYYLPSGTLDLLCTVKNMQHYEPLSNIEVIFYVLKTDLLPEYGISQEEQDSVYADEIWLKYNSITDKFEMYIIEIDWD